LQKEKNPPVPKRILIASGGAVRYACEHTFAIQWHEETLWHYSERDMTFRFVSNIDRTDFAEAVRDLDPSEAR
jgi:hypothetical protein